MPFPAQVFVRREQLGTVTDRGVDSAPDLVVEVLSRSSARDRTGKRERYAHYGVPEYWIIDLDRRHVEVYRLREDPDRATVVTDRLLWQPVANGPVLELDVADLFADVGSCVARDEAALIIPANMARERAAADNSALVHGTPS